MDRRDPRRGLTPAAIALIYTALAAAWIVVSGTALHFVADDPVLQGRIEIAKGLAFVVVTGGLLFLLLRRLHPGGDATSREAPGALTRHELWRLAVMLILLALTVPIAGFAVFALQAKQAEEEAFSELRVVADAKAMQIENWIAERRGDLRSLADSAGFVKRVADIVDGRDAGQRERTRERLDSMRRAYGYDGVELLDARGAVLVSAGDTQPMSGEARAALSRDALAASDVWMSRLQVGSAGRPQLHFAVALARTDGSTPLGLLMLHIDPNRFLFPLVQSWPTASPTAETLLVRRDGETALVLNELRHRKGTALTLRQPLDRDRVPAAAAVSSGAKGSLYGVDYRGVSVLGAWRQVTGTDWHLVAKLDRDEALADARTTALWSAAVTAIAVTLVAFSLLLLLRQQRVAQRLALRVQADALLRQFFDMPFVGIGITEPGTHAWIQFNDYLCTMSGYTREELQARSSIDFVHPEDIGKLVPEIERMMRGESDGYVKEVRFVRKDGGLRIAVLDVRCVRRADGAPQYFMSTVQDVTERREAEERLADSEERYRLLIDNSQDAILLTAPDGGVLSANAAACRMFRASEDELVAAGRAGLVDAGDPRLQQALAERARTGRFIGELTMRRRDGEKFPAEISTSLFTDRDGELRTSMIVRDVSERKRAEERLAHLAQHDPLTDLPNRLLLTDRLNMALAQAGRSRQHVALLFMDLDRFKNVNDSLGHETGDQLLREMAARLKSLLRAADTVSRQGGDEFLVVLPGLERVEDAARIAEKIIFALMQPFALAGTDVVISVSIGIACSPEDGRDAETLLRNADAALYYAKNSGRNRYQFYSAEMNARTRDRLALEADLKRAVERGQLHLVYQPQVDLASGALVGAEALVRWRHPTRGVVPPGDFIGIAEDSGLIAPIGAWVLETACQQHAAWVSAGLISGPVAVNVSAHQFRQADFVPMVESVLRRTGLPAGLLELEVTESVVAQGYGNVLEKLQQLDARGVRLAIDDFGTGYSSLSYLQRFPIHRLKIDQSFTRGLPEDRRNAAIALAVIGMGHSLGLNVLAEGVETPAQEQYLRVAGCDAAQGYLYTRPLPVEEFAEYLREQRSRNPNRPASP